MKFLKGKPENRRLQWERFDRTPSVVLKSLSLGSREPFQGPDGGSNRSIEPIEVK